MKLKQLELHGYKSFANRTEFVFTDGVTAIVGPNGSGKSNCADAVQWVLGEQSFSNLRAKKTEDMIFAGSAQRMRMGMAEVSLTLDNSAQWLPIDFSEVTITRRAYRSGENEYLLNGTRMRLRDIAELLAKGGLGRGSYTVIGQGLIDSAISLRPEERRSLLEDAAGISIYQSKKADALAKLNATHENLTRVRDILHELEPRVRRLREQANRASQFEDVQRRLAERLQTWYGYQWQQAQERLREAEQLRERTHAELLAARERLQASDVERAALRARLQMQRHELGEWQRQLGEQQRIMQELMQRRAVAQERLSLLTQQHDDLQRELEALRLDEASAAATRAQLTTDIETVQSQVQQIGEQLSQLQQDMARREEARRSVQAKHADAQRHALELAAQIAEHTQRIASARQRLNVIIVESAQHQQTVLRLTGDRTAVEQRIGALRTELGARTSQLAARRAQFNDAQQRARELQQTVADLSAQLAEAQAQARATQVELTSARGHGLQQLLEQARAANVQVLGPLRSLYQVAPEHELLVRGALSLLADALVVQSWCDAEQIAALAQTRQAIVVLESFTPTPPLPRFTGEGQGEGETALSLITCAPEHCAMFEALLAHIHVGDSRVPRVTDKGDLITEHTLITADHSALNLAALESRAEEWQRTIQQLSEQLAQARADEEEVGQQRDRLSAEREALESQRARQQHELDGLLQEGERVQQALERWSRALRQLEEERGKVEPQLPEWEQTLAALQQQQSATTAFAAPVMRVEDEQAIARQLAQHETRAALLQQTLQSRQQALAQLSERIQSLAAQRQSKAQRAENLSTEIGRLYASLAQSEAQLGQLQAQLEALQAQVQPAAERLSADEAALRELEAWEHDAREALYAAEAAHSQALVELQRRQDRQATLREQIESDYEFVSLTTDLLTALALEMDENRVLRLPHVRELPDGMEQEIRSLKNKMRWIGHVNLEAPSEYALEKARLEFLTVQSTDLQRASESLQQLVAELDQLMQQKFRETFNAVARAFKEFFTKLFGGGSAELVLTQPENLIATGIDIIAHPPGKRRQPLGLLSGGERALTACALIFALLKASPTPFCVLDEVDAALDEANIGRFRSTLRELSERTQFIIITHNRGTIEAAGTVYGISMGADGASQMISLRLDGVAVREQPTA